MSEADQHAAGLKSLAAAVHEVVERRGKKDLRQWGGPSAATISAIFDGSWTTSPQARGTFDKLDAAGPWRSGTARMLYYQHPSVTRLDPEQLRVDIGAQRGVSESSGRVDPAAGVAGGIPGGLLNKELVAVHKFVDTMQAALDELRDSLRPLPDGDDD